MSDQHSNPVGRPVSGELPVEVSVVVSITDGPLKPSGSLGSIEGCGAVVFFEGVVRGEEGENKTPIAALNYTAYDPMATMELTKLARDVLEKHGLRRVVVEHSRGRVGVGEVSFRLTIWSPHRKESLRAMDEFIDRMKKDVPIWKTSIAGS